MIAQHRLCPLLALRAFATDLRQARVKVHLSGLQAYDPGAYSS